MEDAIGTANDNGMGATEIVSALEQAIEDTPMSGTVDAVTVVVGSFNGAVTDGSPSLGGTGNLFTSLENAPVGAAGPVYNNNDIKTWMKVFGSSADQDTDKKYDGYDSDSYGVAIGAEITNDKNVIGFSFGTSTIDVNGDTNSDAEISSYHFGIYGGLKTEAFFVESALSYTTSDIDMKTTNAISALSTTADTDAETYGLYVGIGSEIELSETMFVVPKLGLTYSHYEQDGYTENGGIRRTFDSYDKDSLVSDLGAKFALKAGALTPEFSVSWLHEFEDSEDNIDYTIAGGTSSYKSNIRAAESDRFKVGIGTGIDCGNNINLSLNYDKEFASDFDSDTFSLTASIKF